MNTKLSLFAARLREFMSASVEPVTADKEIRSRDNSFEGDNSFEALALEVFRLQFEHNLPYRQFCEARGIRPETVTNRQRIPAVPAAAFKELEMSCLAVQARTTGVYSSGT